MCTCKPWFKGQVPHLSSALSNAQCSAAYLWVIVNYTGSVYLKLSCFHAVLLSYCNASVCSGVCNRSGPVWTVLSKVQVLIWRLLSLMSQPSLMSQLDHIITNFLSDKQGVVTLISTALRAMTGDYDPVYGGCRCGLPYSIKKGTQSYQISGSPALQQCGHVVTNSSWPVTDCAAEYGTYLSDHHLDKLLKGYVSDPFLQCGSRSGHVRQSQELEIVCLIPYSLLP